MRKFLMFHLEWLGLAAVVILFASVFPACRNELAKAEDQKSYMIVARVSDQETPSISYPLFSRLEQTEKPDSFQIVQAISASFTIPKKYKVVDTYAWEAK